MRCLRADEGDKALYRRRKESSRFPAAEEEESNQEQGSSDRALPRADAPAAEDEAVNQEPRISLEGTMPGSRVERDPLS